MHKRETISLLEISTCGVPEENDWAVPFFPLNLLELCLRIGSLSLKAYGWIPKNDGPWKMFLLSLENGHVWYLSRHCIVTKTQKSHLKR